jgi:hypothetical protein
MSAVNSHGAAPGPGVVVLGMHRSGTSAVTRALNLLGADVGPAEDLLRDFDNPGGHWESRTLVAANDRVLGTFGRSWDFPPHLRSGWERGAAAQALVPDLASTFASVYRAGTWVWKDPRTCLTLPLWRGVLGDAARVVFVWRDPAAVVHSVWRRDGIPRVYAAGLWHRYVHAAVQGAAGMPVVCVRFEDLLTDARAAVEALADALGTLGVGLEGDRARAAASLTGDLARTPSHGAVVRAMTADVARTVEALPPVSGRFSPPTWREPSWVRPLLYSYRTTWAARARHGHPLKGAPVRRQAAT